MTKAKAATVTAALVNADYFVRAQQVADGTWVVFANKPSGSTSIDAIKTFQDAQGIVASTDQAVFS